MSEEIAPKSLPCPLCDAPMQDGRAGMWLHYLEAGCDYVAALRRIQDFFAPLANSDVWEGLGVVPDVNGDCSGVAEGTLRLHYRPGAPPPWSAIQHVLKGRHVPFDDYLSGCNCYSCQIAVRSVERDHIKKRKWGETDQFGAGQRVWLDEAPSSLQMKVFASQTIPQGKSISASMQDRGKPLKKDIFDWLAVTE